MKFRIVLRVNLSYSLPETISIVGKERREVIPAFCTSQKLFTRNGYCFEKFSMGIIRKSHTHPTQKTATMIRVSIFEDNTEIREFLSETVNLSEELFLVGAYPNANDVLRNIKKDKPDVVLMDIQMPGISGIEALEKIKAQNTDIQVLIQTVFEDNARIFAAICSGASGYILKDSSPERYVDAIIEVYQGGSSMSPAIARKVMTMFSDQNKKQEIFQALSVTEQRVLECLVKGMSYKMIAAECKVSFSTVNFHLKNIYRKLHVNSATEAVMQAIQRHLISY